MAGLSDYKYIEAIRKSLWRGTGFGKAAVMIGAGFSRNAEPKGPSSRPFPLWNDMVTMLVDELYPRSEFPDADRAAIGATAKATSGALRLAEEFEATFGRQKLDDLLLCAVPNQEHQPGKIHRLLLQLPWSDVLTTNYDTLLEQACSDIVEHKYDVVRTIEDISHSMRPRIVKLHGTFPSHRPFIFTEEDFRNYPRRFAPFVNLAQQVMMENVVCLLGFSGDDPNFLYWTGWVRDNLGPSAPLVYLCGLLNLSDSQRLLLHRRNVIPVDLSPRFPTSEFVNQSDRHRAAAEWLLLSLEAGRPPSSASWPNQPEPDALTPPSPGLPAIIASSHGARAAESLHPNE